jgi:hypothetical protein
LIWLEVEHVPDVDPSQVIWPQASNAQNSMQAVLRTKTSLGPLSVMLRYRELLGVEQLFRTAKGAGAQQEALTVVVDVDLLQAVEVAQDLGPFWLAPGVGKARHEFLIPPS